MREEAEKERHERGDKNMRRQERRGMREEAEKERHERGGKKGEA